MHWFRRRGLFSAFHGGDAVQDEVMTEAFTVAAFYHFSDLPDCEQVASRFRELGERLELKGTIIFSTEGVNSTLAGSAEAIEEALAWLRSDVRLAELEAKFSVTNLRPFPRFKVKVKPEIVTFRQPGADPNAAVGEYVEAKDWNALISDPEVITIDTRNDYEVQMGQFEGAVNPKTDKFEDFADFVQKHLAGNKAQKVAMYCTGGIRCERATAFLKTEGFSSVYHLKGGILKYLESVPKSESKWKGDCFVFDYRVGLDHDLKPAGWGISRETGDPIALNDEERAERDQKLMHNH